eukprot:3540686-Prymnesium_polylepis.1
MPGAHAASRARPACQTRSRAPDLVTLSGDGYIGSHSCGFGKKCDLLQHVLTLFTNILGSPPRASTGRANGVGLTLVGAKSPRATMFEGARRRSRQERR